MDQQYSHAMEDYRLEAIVDQSPWSKTYCGKYVKGSNSTLTTSHNVTIKIFHDYKKLEDIYGLTRQIFLAKRCRDHDNIVHVHCSFRYEDQLWVVMRFVDGVSVRSMLQSSFPRGLPKTRIGFILKETLKGLELVHRLGEKHEAIDSDNVFVEKSGSVMLGFGYYLGHNSKESNSRPEWMMAPENQSSKKADIWMFGLLAIELYYGRIPVADQEAFIKLIRSITDYCGGTPMRKTYWRDQAGHVMKLLPCYHSSDSAKKPNRLLGEVMALCLVRNPDRRPTASDLLKHEFFH